MSFDCQSLRYKIDFLVNFWLTGPHEKRLSTLKENHCECLIRFILSGTFVGPDDGL